MSLKNIHSCPRLTQHLVASGVFLQDPLRIVDVGARRGFEDHWSIYQDQVRMIGFEPDSEECARLNNNRTDSINRYFPVALHENNRKRAFYITKQPSSCGFYPVNMELMKRFEGGEENLSIINTIEMETMGFDSFVEENGIDPVDFVKLDTEGCELDILKGASGNLRESVLGLSLEVEFEQMHEGQPLFSDIDIFLRKNGFQLFDLETNRIDRKALPVLTCSAIPGSPVERGQVLSGEALYLRDGVNEIQTSPLLKDGWDDARILKLASIMELFCHPDAAVELIRVAREKGFLKQFDVKHLIDLLVPPVRGKHVSYDEYLKEIKSVRRRGYVDSTERGRQLAAKFLPSFFRKKVRGTLVKLRDVLDKVVR